MSSEHDMSKGNFGEPQPTGDPGAFTQEFQHSQVSARIPEKVGRGMFSTGALVLQGANEFVIDFLLTMMKPQIVAARVVLPPQVMGALINALNENYNNYKSKFGSPPAPPQPPPNQPPPKPPSIDEIYDQLKLPDEMLSGAYSNAVMISHTPAEFCFDFITNFYPRFGRVCSRLPGRAAGPRAAQHAHDARSSSTSRKSSNRHRNRITDHTISSRR